MYDKKEDVSEFRNYKDSQFQDRVQRTYHAMHSNQTLCFVKKMKSHYTQLNHGLMDVYEIFKLLENIIDESDPDNHLPQIEHAYQTAEAAANRFIRNEYKMKDTAFIKGLFRASEWHSLPEKRQKQFDGQTLQLLYSTISDWSWLPLVGFLHDLGKIMLLPAFGALEQWSVVGDTYPVGAPFSCVNVFFDHDFYKESPDYLTSHQQTKEKFGCYERHCGFDQVHMTWGHDEYIYHVMKAGSELPSEGLYLLRYHSFYPWHTPQTGSIGYQELASEKDWHMLPLLKAFQKADLYSKVPELPPKHVLEPKYKGLLDRYIPQRKINW